MEIILTGPEIHVLRETLETDIVNLGREFSRAGELKVREEMEEKQKILRSIVEKLPVEFATA
jgi:hypothetical protein